MWAGQLESVLFLTTTMIRDKKRTQDITGQSSIRFLHWPGIASLKGRNEAVSSSVLREGGPGKSDSHDRPAEPTLSNIARMKGPRAAGKHIVLCSLLS